MYDDVRNILGIDQTILTRHQDHQPMAVICTTTTRTNLILPPWVMIRRCSSIDVIRGPV